MTLSRVCVCAVLQTMSNSSCTTAPISWSTISPMCRSRTQQLRTIKTYSQRPAPYRNMHDIHTCTRTYARTQFTDAWVFAQMRCRFCHKRSMEVDSFVSHVHRLDTHRRTHMHAVLCVIRRTVLFHCFSLHSLLSWFCSDFSIMSCKSCTANSPVR